MIPQNDPESPKPAAESESLVGVASTDLLAVAEWLTGTNTGVSSEYLLAVALCGQVVKSRWGDATPSDAPDLGRCVKLIEQAPSVRICFPVLRKVSPVWAAYVDHWDELTALWHEGDYHVTTGRMKALRSSANASAMAPPPQRLPSTKDVPGG